MPYRTMRTLEDMRGEVLLRMGLGEEGAATVDLHGQIDSFLRKAQRLLWTKFPYTRNRTRISIALSVGVTTYDVPDTFDVGSIKGVSVRTADGLREWSLLKGIRPEDRTAAALSATSSLEEPSRWDLYDNQITVLRSPSSSVTELILDGDLAASALVKDDDVCAVDDEACLWMAAIEMRRFKKLLSGPEAAAEMAEWQEYVEQVSSDQDSGGDFTMGTGWVDNSEADVRFWKQRPWWLANRRP